MINLRWSNFNSITIKRVKKFSICFFLSVYHCLSAHRSFYLLLYPLLYVYLLASLFQCLSVLTTLFSLSLSQSLCLSMFLLSNFRFFLCPLTWIICDSLFFFLFPFSLSYCIYYFVYFNLFICLSVCAFISSLSFHFYFPLFLPFPLWLLSSWSINTRVFNLERKDKGESINL